MSGVSGECGVTCLTVQGLKAGSVVSGVFCHCVYKQKHLWVRREDARAKSWWILSANMPSIIGIYSSRS